MTLRILQWITNQATICDLNTIWTIDSDPKAYCCELVSWIQYDQEIPIPGLNFVNCLQYNKFSDLQCIANLAVICELNVNYSWSDDLKPECLLNFDHIKKKYKYI
jgi:hypothetical protein